jgi:hypothetical protein
MSVKAFLSVYLTTFWTYIKIEEDNSSVASPLLFSSSFTFSLLVYLTTFWTYIKIEEDNSFFLSLSYDILNIHKNRRGQLFFKCLSYDILNIHKNRRGQLFCSQSFAILILIYFFPSSLFYTSKIFIMYL